MHKNLFFSLASLLTLVAVGGCSSDLASLPIYSNTGQLQVVIEVPAGSSHAMQYDSPSKSFVPAKHAGADHVINFLPYPGNFGFIPSTLIEPDENGDSHPLEVLVVAERQETGTVLEVTPLGTLVLEVDGAAKYIVVAVPAKPSEQIISATDYATFNQKYPGAKDIIQKWFVHHNPQVKARVMRWKDEQFTEELVAKSVR